MHRIMNGLFEDHRNLAQVLKTMEFHAEQIAEGDDTPLNIILDASHYITGYADLIHHPKENQIFEVLKTLSNNEATAIETLSQQHISLPSETIKLQKLLGEAINGLGVIRRDDLMKHIKDFIALEWKHMSLEEDVVFPLINDTLEDKDWKVLEEVIENDTDPMFSGWVEDKFKNLYQSINAQVGSNQNGDE